MAFNKYIYHVLKAVPEADTFKNEKMFPKGAKSTDGTFVIMDKRDAVKETIPSKAIPTKPSFAVDALPDWPYLTHQEALKLVKYVATKKGDSDGWKYIKELETKEGVK